MRRAAIYARYSTDRQDERSIDRQFVLCEELAAREQFAVVARYSDEERSSATLHGRRGVAAMLTAARDRLFDVLLIECLDRLSRSQADLPFLYERLTFAGVTIIAVDEGPVDELRVGVRSITGPIALRDVRNKVRGGMAQVVRDGRHAGGRAYGYRPVLGRPGELNVDEGEAEVVRRIFADYVAGLRPRAIAAALNREGVAPPRGKAWNASTINGNRGRGHGILLNELYAGVIVWNRVRMLRDPDTGKRVSRPNTESEIQRAARPELRIVDEATWRAAQAIKQARAHVPAHKSRRPKTLLSGLVRCGHCGGAMVVHDRRKGRVRLRCSAIAESGTCSNRSRVYLDQIERRVLAGLKAKLEAPKFFERFVDEYNAERRRLAGAEAAGRTRLERRAGEVQRELKRAIDAIVVDGVPAASLREKIAALEVEREQLARELEALKPTPVVSLHPAALAAWRRTVADLHGAIARGAEQEVRATFRGLVASVTVTPRANRPPDVEIAGRLAALTDGLFADVGVLLVAEEGLEPPTHGL